MIYILRHCKAIGQDKHANLTEDGQLCAEQLVQVLANLNIDQIYISNMKRTYETIKPYISKYQVNVITDSRLNERQLSDISLDNWLNELKYTFEDFDYHIHNGESSSEAQKRILSVYESINQSYNSLIVTHGNIMTLLLNHFNHEIGFEEWKALKNPDLYSIDKYNNVKHISMSLNE